jgi:hypothetical protein
MRRYLVVANQTLGGGQLLAKVRELASAGPAAFHVLVPSTPPKDHAWVEAEARTLAEERLQRALVRLAELGVEADGEVGDEHPIDAIRDVIERGEEFDAIVLSTLPPGISRWLRTDLVHRVEGFGIPVIHVIGHKEPARV